MPYPTSRDILTAPIWQDQLLYRGLKAKKILGIQKWIKLTMEIASLFDLIS